MPYFVYVLECADQSYYIGVTNDLDLRIIEPKTGSNLDSFTFSRRPVELKWFASFTRIESAIEKEKQLKKWSRKKKKALIENDWTRVSEYSKKRFS
jgi:putative endonuclease